MRCRPRGARGPADWKRHLPFRAGRAAPGSQINLGDLSAEDLAGESLADSREHNADATGSARRRPISFRDEEHSRWGGRISPGGSADVASRPRVTLRLLLTAGEEVEEDEEGGFEVGDWDEGEPAATCSIEQVGTPTSPTVPPPLPVAPATRCRKPRLTTRFARLPRPAVPGARWALSGAGGAAHEHCRWGRGRDGCHDSQVSPVIMTRRPQPRTRAHAGCSTFISSTTTPAG